jgi:uncharacterized membrane protein YhiD involved in acid resistance
MDKLTVALLAAFIAVLLATGLLAYVVRDRSAVAGGPDLSQGTNTIPRENRSLISQLFGPDYSGPTPTDSSSWESTAARIALRFSLAAFLAALLAFRPRRGVPINQRNPYVAQTQILMAVVAAAMMMVVGDSAARAFGIFAAASLVRFRTNIRDPKEITVLLICLGVGLAAGVGRWDMALILSLFVIFTLFILEYFEQAQVFRSMEICVATRNVDRTNEALKKVFARHHFDIEVREMDREDEEDPLGKIVYLVNLSTKISTNRLSEEIFSVDPEGIDRIEWDQKKSGTYIYR